MQLLKKLAGEEVEWQAYDPSFTNAIQILSENYAAMRQIRGDGNCFYRSFMFSYLEHILESQDKAEVDRVTANIEQCKNTLQSLGYADFTIKDIFALFLEQLENLLQGNESSISHEDLVQRSQDQFVSDYGLLRSGEIRRRSEFFTPFIRGLSNKTVEQNVTGSVLSDFCGTHGEESDHVHIMALSDALGVPIRVVYLDHSSSDANDVSINHHDIIPTVGSKSYSDPMKPFITLLYHSCPGHYDILYPKQSDSLVKPKRPDKTRLTEHEKMEERSNLQGSVSVNDFPFDTDNEEMHRFSVFGEMQSFSPVLHNFTRSAHALDKNSAGYEKLEKENSEDVDQRNLYLAKEGIIREGSPAVEGVSSSDIVKRQALEKKRNFRLQSPDFYVSRTRLVVYNFPNAISERRLKKIFEDAVLSRVSEPTPIIQKLKILGQTKDAEATKNYPRGIALVEFAEHQHALVALRVLNNNAGKYS
ncbi:hypothetical protein MKW92_040458 [Papaver armeniacum]|nr:hypothetical protein MKW92_040458 [Papaver armeniacum]